MARPRKLSTDEMLHIVNSYFETNGDPGMLKCSFLEEYALSLGVNVKAYDFRRNESVRKSMEELRGIVGTGNAVAIAYKGMDVDALLNRSNTRETLRNSLLELDESWRRVYERAAVLTRHNASLLADIFAKKQEVEALAAQNSELESTNKTLKKSSNALVLENRYLKKMLKQYLYPAIANEILKSENVLEQADTDVTEMAMANLVDPFVPASFPNSIAADTTMLSREEALLKRMSDQIHGGRGNA